MIFLTLTFQLGITQYLDNDSVSILDLPSGGVGFSKHRLGSFYKTVLDLANALYGTCKSRAAITSGKEDPQSRSYSATCW